MRTDTIFYKIFLTFHSLLFELIGLPDENGDGYEFISVEVKEKAFRFDGIFMPNSEDTPIYFVEVQFQPKTDFYWEFITEINIYLNQYKPVQDWKAVAIFAKRSIEPEKLTLFQQELLATGRIIPIYLDELPSGSIGIDLIGLIVSKEAQTLKIAKQLMQRTEEIGDVTFKQGVVELLLECLVSKFSNLTRQEIEAMFLVNDLKQTRFYQDVRQDVRQEEAETLLMRQLSKRFGKLSDRHQTQISALEIAQLEDLAEALLDFQSLSDLELWLQSKDLVC